MLIFVGFLLLVLSALCVGVMVPVRIAARRGDARPDTPPYAARGPHPVGTRDLVVAGEAPLELTTQS